eukprot:scaffold14901_cov54-Cylindrotheca_fusiformis.AAC.1
MLLTLTFAFDILDDLNIDLYPPKMILDGASQTMNVPHSISKCEATIRVRLTDGQVRVDSLDPLQSVFEHRVHF